MALIAGNWKMNGRKSSVSVLDALLAATVDGVELLVCPPFPLLAAFAERAAGSPVRIGGQDCHAAPDGAHTGDVSADMLADAGCTHVILGHSERRADHGETDAIVGAKVGAAWRAGLVPILCVGETRAEREAGRTLEVVTGQLAGSLPERAGPLVLAYEPVWAIGTGLVPTPGEVAEVHAALAARLGPDVPILYGGSVKAANAAELLAVPHVGGALVGGASLEAGQFLAIARAAPKACMAAA